MKRTLFGLILLAVALLAFFATATYQAAAQVPAGVVVDSIGPANSFLNIFPLRSHSVVADPKTGKYAFVPGSGSAGASPVWFSSSDGGATWSNLTGFLPASAGRVAIAADSNFTCYITYRMTIPGTSFTGIYFNRDPNGDGTGLETPVLANDTLVAALPNYPDIVVSKDGKHVIISGINRGAGAGTPIDTVYAFVSHDSGKTWQTQVIVNPFDPSLHPINGGWGIEPTMWYTSSLAMGANGFASFCVSLTYDSTAGNLWDVYTETHDYGDHWSKPAWLPTPDPNEYSTGFDFWSQGPTVVTHDSITHIVERLAKPGGQAELVEYHKVNGAWTWRAITHYDPATTSYDDGREGSLGLDSQGRLYCLYTDKNKSAFPSFGDAFWTTQLFITGSSDGGATWTGPVRLTDKEPIAVGSSGDLRRVSITRLPNAIPDNAAGIFLNGVYPDLYGAGAPVVTAWGQARFPLSVVWTGPYDKDTRAPKPNGYAITAKGASPFNWYEVSGTGTKVTGWRNGAPAFGDSARDDGSAGPFPIGFDFWFYGKTYSTFSVGANALMGLSDSILNNAVNSADPANTKGFYDASYYFPGPGNPFHSVIAAYYNDLDLTPHALYGTGHGDVYYWTNTAKDTLVVEWYKAGDFNSDSDTTLTFEVILAKADSSVGIMFKDVGNTGTDVTAKVGIQAADTVGLAYWLGGYPPGNLPANNTGVVFKHSGTTSVGPGQGTPMTFAMYQNYPNPFNPATKITYTLPKQVRATLKVFNILGQEVATLVDQVETAGQHTLTFDGAHLASGVYIYRLQAGEFSSSFKMILMK